MQNEMNSMKCEKLAKLCSDKVHPVLQLSILSHNNVHGKAGNSLDIMNELLGLAFK